MTANLTLSYRERVVDIMAKTIWGEARGCGANAMVAVANVISNRVMHARWWGRDIVSVCLSPFQFSCWNVTDPNREKLLAVSDDNPWFVTALDIAHRAASGKLQDLTNGADSYYAIAMLRPPTWAARALETYRDGWHVFFRVETLSGQTLKPDAPCISVRTGLYTADDLNDAELLKLRQANPFRTI